MEKDNPKLRKNGGKGTTAGNILRGIIKVGKNISPQLKGIIEGVEGMVGLESIEEQLQKENFSPAELEYLMAQVDKDKQELQEITKRWEADMDSGSWMAKNVRPWTLVLYNVSIMVFIALDSYMGNNFEVKNMWLNILISNAGIVNTAYFGSRYLEKRDSKKYK